MNLINLDASKCLTTARNPFEFQFHYLPTDIRQDYANPMSNVVRNLVMLIPDMIERVFLNETPNRCFVDAT